MRNIGAFAQGILTVNPDWNVTAGFRVHAAKLSRVRSAWYRPIFSRTVRGVADRLLVLDPTPTGDAVQDEVLAQIDASHTGRYLREVLAVGRANAYGTR